MTIGIEATRLTHQHVSRLLWLAPAWPGPSIFDLLQSERIPAPKKKKKRLPAPEGCSTLQTVVRLILRFFVCYLLSSMRHSACPKMRFPRDTKATCGGLWIQRPGDASRASL